MTPKNIFKAGYVAKAHGLKGEVTINLLRVELPQKIEQAFLELDGQFKEFKVEQFSARPDKAFLKLAGINSIEEAMALRGHQVFFSIPKRSASKGEFYAEEIIGFTVEDRKEGEIGQVSGLSGIPGNRLIEVVGATGEILLPLNSPFIIQIDKKKKWLLVELPDGYLSI